MTLQKQSWLQLRVAPLAERIVGFSIPVNQRFIVLAYDGVLTVRLSDRTEVISHEEIPGQDLYDSELGCAEYWGERYRVLGYGYDGGIGITHSPQGDELRLNVQTQRIQVVSGVELTLDEPFENLSGDWSAATFSDCGGYVVLGCPYDFDMRVYRRLL